MALSLRLIKESEFHGRPASAGVSLVSISCHCRQEICFRQSETRFMVSFLYQQQNFAVIETLVQPVKSTSDTQEQQLSSSLVKYIMKQIFKSLKGHIVLRRTAMRVITAAGLSPLNSLWGASDKVLCYDPALTRVPASSPHHKETPIMYAGVAQTNPVIFMLFVL